jgi:hypothetical protein
MPAAQARIRTERASRYLAQFRQHVTSISAHGTAIARRRRRQAHGGAAHPTGTPPRAEWTDTHGTISFPGGTITLQATPDALIVRANASSEADLRRAQDHLTGHLARFGRRDQHTVAWQPPDPPA